MARKSDKEPDQQDNKKWLEEFKKKKYKTAKTFKI